MRWKDFVKLCLCFLLVLSGCGGGRSGGGMPPPEPSPAQTQPEPSPAPQPDPPPPPPPPPPPAPTTCMPPTPVQTKDGCLSDGDYERTVEERAVRYRENQDFKNQWGLRAINAGQAYARLELAPDTGGAVGGAHPDQFGNQQQEAPGTGVTVGVVDTGIKDTHPLFDQSKISEPMTIDCPPPPQPCQSPRHGTAVASVIVAKPNSGVENGFHGVAWGANLKMFTIRIGSGSPPGTPYRPTSTSALKVEDPTLAALIQTVLNQGVDVANFSFSYAGLIEYYSEEQLRENLGETIAAIAQRGRADKTILVWSASNSHGDLCRPTLPNCGGNHRRDRFGRPAGSLRASSPSIIAGLPAKIPELRGHMIAVVAVNPPRSDGSSGTIAHFSNQCGEAAKWCLAAPGVSVAVADISTDGVRSGSGTSYAAPMVTGGLAVMKHRFRDQIPNTDLVKRLFATADKTGKYADYTLYGQGMMDLGKALMPVGEPMVSLGSRVNGAGVTLALTNLRLGTALGDGLKQSLAGQQIAAFDSLGAPFWFTLSDLTGMTAGPSSAVRLRQLMQQDPVVRETVGQRLTFIPGRVGGSVEHDLGYATIRVGLRDTPNGVKDGHFHLAQNANTLTLMGDDGVAFTAFTRAGSQSRVAGLPPTSGAALSWSPFEGTLGFTVAWLREQRSLLGTSSAGAFGTMAAHSFVSGVETGVDLGAWRIDTLAELGTVQATLSQGMVTEMSPLATSAFALSVSRRLLRDGSLRIGLSQPLRVEDGHLALSLPVGRTKGGAVIRQRRAASLRPSGRQIDVSAQWQQSFANGHALRVKATWMRHPGHNAHATPALSVLAGWQFTF